MANRRLPMRKIKEVLRLRFECNLSEREIARSCQISRTTVTDYLRRVTIARLNWAEVSVLGEVQLLERLFPVMLPALSSIQRPAPDYANIYKELRTYRKFNLRLNQPALFNQNIRGPKYYQEYGIFLPMKAIACKVLLLFSSISGTTGPRSSQLLLLKKICLRTA